MKKKRASVFFFFRFAYYAGLIFGLFFFIPACSDDETDTISEIPEIEFVMLAPQQIKANHDTLKITIFYKDGNGDLGSNDSEVENLIVIDNRIGLQTGFRIKQLAPDNANIAIQGNLEILLQNISFIDPLQNIENFTYSLYLKDRAGHQSNTITTSVAQLQK